MGRLVHLEIDGATLRLAILYVLEAAGHRRSRGLDDADHVVVDRAGLRRVDGPCDVLVIDPSPAACQEALDVVYAGRVRAVVPSDDPEAVLPALAGVAEGRVVLPALVIAEANRAPRLEPRLGETLHLVLAGCTTEAIAQRLHQSVSTVKRDIAALLANFGAPNRVALVGAARAAGYDGPVGGPPAPIGAGRANR